MFNLGLLYHNYNFQEKNNNNLPFYPMQMQCNISNVNTYTSVCVDKHSECNKHGNSIILINVQKLHILVQGND